MKGLPPGNIVRIRAVLIVGEQAGIDQPRLDGKATMEMISEMYARTNGHIVLIAEMSRQTLVVEHDAQKGSIRPCYAF